MRKILITVLSTCIGLSGLATPATAGLFSATGAVIAIAILADELFVGEAEGHLGGAGTLAIRSQRDPRLTCRGEFTSSAELGGAGQMNCSDGIGSFSRGSMTFVYRLIAEEAGRYLTLPKGKKLMYNGTELVLADL